MKIATSLFLASFVAACSAGAPADDGNAAASAIHGGSICPPLAYPHAIANDRYFRQFESDAAATEYVTKLLANGKLAEVAGDGAALKEVNQDARLARLVGDVFAGFRRVYPAATAGMDAPPRVVVLESEIVNAYAMGTGSNEDDAASADTAPWLFFVNTALLNQGGSDSELRGLFAHELGHLILRNNSPDVRKAIRAVYRVEGSERGVLGETQADDPVLAVHVEKMRVRQTRVGGWPKLGLPVDDADGYAKLFGILGNEAARATETPSDACIAASRAKQALQAAQLDFVPGAARGDLTPRTPDASESAKLEAMSQTLAAGLLACTSPLADPLAKGSLLDAVALMNDLPATASDPASPDHAKLLGFVLDEERATDAASVPSAPLLPRLLDAQSRIRSQLVTLQDDPTYPIDQIRIYDYEEDADDVAVRILAAIGDDPLSVGDFFLDRLLAPADKATCLADVAAGRAIPYGRSVDVHPPTCWRYYHVTQLATALATCAPVPSGVTRNPRGSNIPSAADRPVKVLVEKGYGTGTR